MRSKRDENGIPLWGQELGQALRGYRYFTGLLTMVSDENNGTAWVDGEGRDRYAFQWNDTERRKREFDRWDSTMKRRGRLPVATREQ